MNWQNLHGHQALEIRFREAAQRGRIGNTYLFVGPAGIGKRTFAKLLAKSFLCESHHGS